MLGALAAGKISIKGLLLSAVLLQTAICYQVMGTEIADLEAE